MDSFACGGPRKAPVPTTIKKIERVSIIPEVSMVDNSFYNSNPIRPLNVFDNNHDKSGNHSLSYLKKHVRFQSPQTIQSSGKENNPQPYLPPNLNGKTFKQIYMANVPNRHLDLSILEPPSEPLFPSTSKPDHLNSLVDLDLKKKSGKLEYNPTKYSEFSNSSNEQMSCREIAKANDDPTIKDLYKIIQQQNEQIMMLQRQVNNLKTSIRQPEPDLLSLDNVTADRPFMKEITNSPTKKGLFSIDLKATSFEVSFRPQPNKFRNKQELEPKIQEIIECDINTETLRDNQDMTSLHLEDSLNLKDSYVSAAPSIQINMDDYQSSDEEEHSVNVGITFYKNLMDQVNNVLKKMQIKSECHIATINKRKGNDGQTMKMVKQATLQHLKSIGVNLSPIQEATELTATSSTNQNNSEEVSFAVKQLLMKYLPDDKLTQAMNKPKSLPINIKENVNPGNSDFSFATLQYMKKYNMLNNKKQPEVKKLTKISVSDSPKILDVTALKMQPKLL